MYDLLIQQATVIDPAQSLHARKDVAFAGGRVAAVADGIEAAEAATVIDGRGKLLTAGWIDLHVHVFDGVSHYGIAPDPHCIARGVTTAVDAGSAGADTFPGFRRYVIEASATRLFAQLNISSQGMISQEMGELLDIRWADVGKALKVIEANRDVILGVKVRLERDRVCSEESGLRPLQLAREAADAAGLPIMVHPQLAWADSLDDILALMRKDDIVTHCFHGFPVCGILDEQGRVREAAREAAARGMIFDVGHGRGSFDWRVAEAALAQGFWPQTISSDLHRYNVDGPVYDLATTASKFLQLGLPLDEVIARVTAAPARVIRQPDLGTLRVGACGDATLLELQSGEFALRDARGQARTGSQRLMPVGVVRAGQVYKADG
ncbi:MAG: amidohydrolase/deacetylase family metallohydrolase [Chloroflexi bacterium]|nr:amidohydrolase/deacetylase family metallohydrolase [Chloroflexota bacterium]